MTDTSSKKKSGRKPTPKRREAADGTVTIHGKNPNGKGTAYWSSSAGRWEAKAIHPRTKQRVKRTGATREEAEGRLAEALADAPTEVGPLGPDPTFAELLSYYLTWVAAPPRIAVTTATAYAKQARTLADLAGDRPVKTMTKADGQKLVNELFTKWSYDHARNCRGLAKRVLGEAVDLEYLPRNPLDRVTSPPRPNTGPKRTLTGEEQHRLVMEAIALDDDGLLPKYRLGPAVALLFALGARVSEIIGLKWEDIDWKNEQVSIVRAVTYLDGHGPIVKAPKTKTTVGTRHLPLFLHKSLLAVERQQKRETIATRKYRDPAGDGFVFVGTRGQLLNRQAVTKELRRILDAVEIDPAGIGTHSGRRTFITRAYIDGAATEDVAEEIGHSDPATTRGYVQDRGDRPMTVTKRMAAMIENGGS